MQLTDEDTIWDQIHLKKKNNKSHVKFYTEPIPHLLKVARF